jgi:hypothetical protein
VIAVVVAVGAWLAASAALALLLASMVRRADAAIEVPDPEPSAPGRGRADDRDEVRTGRRRVLARG